MISRRERTSKIESNLGQVRRTCTFVGWLADTRQRRSSIDKLHGRPDLADRGVLVLTWIKIGLWHDLFGDGRRQAG